MVFAGWDDSDGVAGRHPCDIVSRADLELVRDCPWQSDLVLCSDFRHILTLTRTSLLQLKGLPLQTDNCGQHRYADVCRWRQAEGRFEKVHPLRNGRRQAQVGINVRALQSTAARPWNSASARTRIGWLTPPAAAAAPLGFCRMHPSAHSFDRRCSDLQDCHAPIR